MLFRILFALLIPSGSSYNAPTNRISRQRFLPYGDSLKPVSRGGQADFAIDASSLAIQHCCQAVSISGGVIVAKYKVLPVETQRVVILVRSKQQPTLTTCNSLVYAIDAGPFGSLDHAVEAVRRWRTYYFSCHRSPDGTNSCFEFGGCHAQCWWRNPRHGAVQKVEQCGSSTDGLNYLLGVLNQPWQEASPIEDKQAVHKDGGEMSGIFPLSATFVAFGDIYYCALKPVKYGIYP